MGLDNLQDADTSKFIWKAWGLVMVVVNESVARPTGRTRGVRRWKLTPSTNFFTRTSPYNRSIWGAVVGVAWTPNISNSFANVSLSKTGLMCSPVQSDSILPGYERTPAMLITCPGDQLD